MQWFWPYLQGVLVPLTDSKIACHGAASDRQAAFSDTRTSHFASVHPLLHGHRPLSSRSACPSGAGLLHLCLVAEGGAPAIVDRISGDHHVCPASGVAAKRSSDLHTTGGLPQPFNDNISKMSR